MCPPLAGHAWKALRMYAECLIRQQRPDEVVHAVMDALRDPLAHIRSMGCQLPTPWLAPSPDRLSRRINELSEVFSWCLVPGRIRNADDVTSVVQLVDAVILLQQSEQKRLGIKAGSTSVFVGAFRSATALLADIMRQHAELQVVPNQILLEVAVQLGWSLACGGVGAGIFAAETRLCAPSDAALAGQLLQWVRVILERDASLVDGSSRDCFPVFIERCASGLRALGEPAHRLVRLEAALVRMLQTRLVATPSDASAHFYLQDAAMNLYERATAAGMWWDAYDAASVLYRLVGKCSVGLSVTTDITFQTCRSEYPGDHPVASQALTGRLPSRSPSRVAVTVDVPVRVTAEHPAAAMSAVVSDVSFASVRKRKAIFALATACINVEDTATGMLLLSHLLAAVGLSVPAPSGPTDTCLFVDPVQANSLASEICARAHKFETAAPTSAGEAATAYALPLEDTLETYRLFAVAATYGKVWPLARAACRLLCRLMVVASCGTEPTERERLDSCTRTFWRHALACLRTGTSRLGDGCWSRCRATLLWAAGVAFRHAQAQDNARILLQALHDSRDLQDADPVGYCRGCVELVNVLLDKHEQESRDSGHSVSVLQAQKIVDRCLDHVVSLHSLLGHPIRAKLLFSATRINFARPNARERNEQSLEYICNAHAVLRIAGLTKSESLSRAHIDHTDCATVWFFHALVLYRLSRWHEAFVAARIAAGVRAAVPPHANPSLEVAQRLEEQLFSLSKKEFGWALKQSDVMGYWRPRWLVLDPEEGSLSYYRCDAALPIAAPPRLEDWMGTTLQFAPLRAYSSATEPTAPAAHAARTRAPVPVLAEAISAGRTTQRSSLVTHHHDGQVLQTVPTQILVHRSHALAGISGRVTLRPGCRYILGQGLHVKKIDARKTVSTSGCP